MDKDKLREWILDRMKESLAEPNDDTEVGFRSCLNMLDREIILGTFDAS